MKILIEGADIFEDVDEIYQGAKQGDYKAVGAGVTHLVTTLQQSVCQNNDDKTCVIVEGILESLEVFLVDMGECKVRLHRGNCFRVFFS